MWPFRVVAAPVCGFFGLWPFRSVAVPVCGRFALWPFRAVAVSVCGRFGLWPFRLWPFRFVAVMTCYPNTICWQLHNPFLSIPQLTLYMITNTMRPSLLWIFFLNVYDVQSQCTTNDACWLKNTRGVSIDSSLIPRNSIYPDSCLRFCSRSSECVAATCNPNADPCELHEAGAEGAPCMTLVADVGSSFWMMKYPERQCPKVRCGIFNAFLNGLTKSVKFAHMEPKYIIGTTPFAKSNGRLFQTQKSTWCPQSIYTIFGGCMKCM